MALVALAVFGAPAAGQDTAADWPLAEIAELAERRTTAVREKDEATFMATVDPAAPDDFRRAQQRTFAGLTQLPLDGYTITVDDEETGDLSPPGLSERRYQDAPTYLPETTQTYRIGGYDDRDAVDALWITYVQRQGEWFVGGDTDLDGVGLKSDLSLWDLGPIRLMSTDHFLVISHPDTADRADELARLAEAALVEHTRVWDRPWSQRIPIVLPSSVDELEILLQSTFDLDNFVAFVAYGIDRDAPSGYETTAPRMYIQDRNLSSYDEDFQIETLVHELVHAATAAQAGPFVDDWVHEGVADWVSSGRPTDDKLPDGSDGRLPDPYEFRTGGSEAILAAYGESRSAVSFLAATDGAASPADFFATLGSPRRAPGNTDHHVGEALRATTGRTLEDFEKAWAGW